MLCHWPQRSQFFSERVVNIWNNLPDRVDFSSFTNFIRNVRFTVTSIQRDWQSVATQQPNRPAHMASVSNKKKRQHHQGSEHTSFGNSLNSLARGLWPTNLTERDKDLAHHTSPCYSPHSIPCRPTIKWQSLQTRRIFFLSFYRTQIFHSHII